VINGNKRSKEQVVTGARHGTIAHDSST